MEKLKYYVSAFRRFAGRCLQSIRQWIDKIIPKEMQLLVCILLIAGELLLTYLLMLFHIGIWNSTFAVGELLELYIVDGEQFPWLLYLLLSAGLVGFILYLFNSNRADNDRNFKYSDSDVYGSAGEISEDDLRKVGELKPIEALEGTILGQLDDTGRKVIGMTPNPTANKNLMVLASPGQGKSYSVVKNQIVQAFRRGESVVCTDTKGEVRADTIELARLYGYTIRNINLKYLKYSDGWHVLKELRLDDERAMIFAKIVMRNTENQDDPHMAPEEALLTACCLYVERNPMIPPNEKTFYKVYTLVSQGPDKLGEIFAEAKFNSDLRIACDYFAIYQGSDNLKSNVIANLASRLKVLASPVVQQLTSYDDVDLTLPGKKKCIYYVTMSDQHDTMKFLASLFFTFLFLDLGDFADAQMNQRLPVPVNVILEEAANVGEIVGLTNYLATARSRAIAITLIFQGYSQIRKTYGIEDTETILNCCSVHACLGVMERGTAEHFEWLSGVATVKVKTEQHDAFESPLTADYRHSTGDGRRNVFLSNEVRKIKQGYVILCWLGYDAIKCRTFGIVQHPEYKKGHMPKISPMPAIPLDNIEARAFLRAMEEQRIMDYEAWENDGGIPWDGYDFPRPKCDGPSKYKPRPKVIPYPELEQMALEHSQQLHNPFSNTVISVNPKPPMPSVMTGDNTLEETPEPTPTPAAAPMSEQPASLPEAVISPRSTDTVSKNTEQAVPPTEAVEIPAVIATPSPKPQSRPSAPPTPTRPKRSGSGTLYANRQARQDKNNSQP